MKYFKLIQKLSAEQWLWVWRAYWRLLVTQLRIKLKQQNWLRERLSSKNTQGASMSGEIASLPAEVLDLHEAVRLAARMQFWSTDCLPRSIVLVDMLNSRGFAAQLKLGVNTKKGDLTSHAWVELDGHMVGEPDSVSDEFSAFE